MKISDKLASFRESVLGCKVVVFADLSTGMVLASSTAEKTTQEKLDALCMRGRDALNASLIASVAAKCSDAEKPVADFAMRADRDVLDCYLRAPEPAEEALCFTINPVKISDQVLKDASSLLRCISTESS